MLNLKSEIQTIYSSAKYNGKPLEPDLENIMETSRDESELRDTWIGWRRVTGAAIRSKYHEFVTLVNQGAKDHGNSPRFYATSVSTNSTVTMYNLIIYRIIINIYKYF